MAEHGDLRATLDAIASRGATHLRRVRARRAIPDVVARAAPLVLVVPAVWLAARLAGAPLNAPLNAPTTTPWTVILLAPVPPLLALLLGFLRALARRVRRPLAVGVLDRVLEAGDRLVAADSFLARSSRTGFMEASVEDAERFAREALEAAMPDAPAARPSPWRPVLWAAAAALLVVAGILVPDAAPPPEVEIAGTPPGGSTPLAGRETSEETDVPDRPGRPTVEGERRDRPSIGPGEATESEQPSADLPQQAKVTEGRTGSGPGAGSQSTSGANDARGVPGNQGPATVSKKEPKPSTAKPRKPRESDDEPPKIPTKEMSDESGTTAGRGASRGSSRNPVASDWSSKDQVSSEDEDVEDDDDEVEDEESSSEARGGVQPSLRDRKPPVSRDLSIGFGDRTDPDANGRGGPSPPKKSRGTASLVLGVPIPDRVRGQRNPGRTKITQERVEPRREESDPVDAEARAGRSAPAGHVESVDLEPWMRRLIREYFLTIRSQDPEK